MATRNQISETSELRERERETLFCVVGHMIPLSEDYGVPGASDDDIFADILRSIGRDGTALLKALKGIEDEAGGSLTALATREQRILLDKFRIQNPELARVIEAVTVRCYYRDNRVMTSIGMENRPPFPLGYDVEQGDWSLLDPVRSRGPIYREVKKD